MSQRVAIVRVARTFRSGSMIISTLTKGNCPYPLSCPSREDCHNDDGKYKSVLSLLSRKIRCCLRFYSWFRRRASGARPTDSFSSRSLALGLFCSTSGVFLNDGQATIIVQVSWQQTNASKYSLVFLAGAWRWKTCLACRGRELYRPCSSVVEGRKAISLDQVQEVKQTLVQNGMI